MRVIKGDLFITDAPVNAICIPTNGIVKANGKAVMGAGVAKVARDKFTGLDERLGELLRSLGNHVHWLGDEYGTFKDFGPELVSFPTKYHWRDPSDINLIRQSCIELVELTNAKSWKSVWLPPVGCGLGALEWADVSKVLGDVLDDRFAVVFKD